MLKSDVFKRTYAEGAIVSDATYNLVIGLVLCWGFLINWLIVYYIKPESLIAINIAQGNGLLVKIMDITSCTYCGAEREVYEILDPTAEDTEALTEDDQTRHEEHCPTLNPNGIESEDVVQASCESLWRTAPAVVIEHPHRYQPLGTAPSATAQQAAQEVIIEEVPDGESLEITNEDKEIVTDATA